PGTGVDGAARTPWTPPPDLGALPALVDLAALPAAQRGVLTSLGATVNGQPFVAGLYRMLAGWPGFFAHVATLLRPRMDDRDTGAACRRLLEAVDADIPTVFATLPPLPTVPPRPPPADFPAALAAPRTPPTTRPAI